MQLIYMKAKYNLYQICDNRYCQIITKICNHLLLEVIAKHFQNQFDSHFFDYFELLNSIYVNITWFTHLLGNT